jgi:long-chain fatty acid transport protein
VRLPPPTTPPGGLAAAVFVLAAAPAPAAASVAEVFGASSRHAATAGAATATATDHAAVYYNPAGLAFAERSEVSIGISHGASFLDVAGRRQPLRSPFGVHIGSSTPLPFGGFLRDRLAVGLGLYVPGDLLVQVVGHAADDAFFPLYDNRTQRLVVMPALAVRLTEDLAIGAGADVLAKLVGEVRAVPGPTRALDPTSTNDLRTIARFAAGARLRLSPEIVVGLTWRDAFAVSFDTAASTSLDGRDIGAAVAAQTLFTPALLATGVAWHMEPAWDVALDVVYRRWSDVRLPYVAIAARLPLPLPGADALHIVTPPPTVRLRDTLGARVGCEWRAADLGPVALTLRGGLGYEPSPVPRQDGVTNLADSDKWTLATGAGFALPLSDRAAVQLDAHLQAHVLPPRRSAKRVALVPDEDAATPGLQTRNPGYPSFTAGGAALAWGLQLTLTR